MSAGFPFLLAWLAGSRCTLHPVTTTAYLWFQGCETYYWCGSIMVCIRCVFQQAFKLRFGESNYCLAAYSALLCGKMQLLLERRYLGSLPYKHSILFTSGLLCSVILLWLPGGLKLCLQNPIFLQQYCAGPLPEAFDTWFFPAASMCPEFWGEIQTWRC